MEDRVSYLKGIFVGLQTSDLQAALILLQSEIEHRKNQQQLVQVKRAPAIVASPDKPLPLVGAKPTPPAWKPSQGNASIRLVDEQLIAPMSPEAFKLLITPIIEEVEVQRRQSDGKMRKVKARLAFFYVFKDEEDPFTNAVILCFPKGAKDMCDACLAPVKAKFASAAIYTGSVKRGDWEFLEDE